MLTQEEYSLRRENLIKLMPKEGIILMPSATDSPMNYPSNTYPYYQDSTFRYFFGLGSPFFVGYIDLESEDQILFGENPTMDDIIWSGKKETLQQKAEKIGITQTKELKDLETFIKSAQEKGRKIHFLPPYQAEVKNFISSLTKEEPSTELALAVVRLRERKSPLEIEQLDKIVDITNEMQTLAMILNYQGRSEKQIAQRIDYLAHEKANGLSFKSIVSQNGQILHNTESNAPLKNGRLLLIDCGAVSDEFYAGDLTRTTPVGGKFSTQQKEIYNIVYRASNLAFALSKPDVLYQDIHLSVARQISEDLSTLGLLKGNIDDIVNAGAYSLFMPHGLGHMLGMDVHDMENIGENYVGYDKYTQRSETLGVRSLRMGRKLTQGFTMTVEPGIYFIPELINKWKNEGTAKDFINFSALESYLNFGGIRLEDDMLITEESNRILGKNRAPASIEEIENCME